MGAPVSYTSPSLLTTLGVATAILSFLMALGVAPPSPSTALGPAAPSQNSPRTLSTTRPTVPSTYGQSWMLMVLSLVLARRRRSLTHGQAPIMLSLVPTAMSPMVLSLTVLSPVLALQRRSLTHGRVPTVLSPMVLSLAALS